MSKVFNNVYLKLKEEYEQSDPVEYNSKNLLKNISTTLDNLYKNLLNIELILKEITLFDTNTSEEFLNLSYKNIEEVHKSFPKIFFDAIIEESYPETYLDAIEELIASVIILRFYLVRLEKEDNKNILSLLDSYILNIKLYTKNY
jgi:hypothetical protein